MLAPAEEAVLSRLLSELVRLSPAARLEAVSRLLDSVKNEPTALKEPRKTLADFSGAWKDDPDADAMEEAILKGRTSNINHHLEDWE